MELPPAVIVHGLAMACEALQAAASCARPITLLSAENAASYAGVGWWQALMRQACAAVPHADMRHVLDCGASPGHALEALREGQRLLVLRTGVVVWADIAERAVDCGAVLLAEAPAAYTLREWKKAVLF